MIGSEGVTEILERASTLISLLRTLSTYLEVLQEAGSWPIAS